MSIMDWGVAVICLVWLTGAPDEPIEYRLPHVHSMSHYDGPLAVRQPDRVDVWGPGVWQRYECHIDEAALMETPPVSPSLLEIRPL